MKNNNFTYHSHFTTATILEWKHLLKEDVYKEIIINSLRFLHNEESIVIYGFVIMPNHIHIIWQIQDEYVKEKIQMRFLKFTAQQMKFKLIDTKDKMLNEFFVNAKDRKYQIWERNSLSIDLWSEKVFVQKLDYIHSNPIKHPWYLAKLPEEYKYSSAKFYETGMDEFGFLSHYRC
ncbi:MAG: transposase [Chitinophagaceae bacterium]